MLTYEDCLGVADLTQPEVDAIARHEHLPVIVALELGCCLRTTPDGMRRIRSMLYHDPEVAREHREIAAAARLRLALAHHIAARPRRHGA